MIGRLLVAALIFAVLGGVAEAQQETPGCYYIADSVTDAGAAEAAARFAFPWRMGQPASPESRAVHQVFERTIAEHVRSIGGAHLVERTSIGRRYVRPNGIVVELRVQDCEEGLDEVRSYLRGLESIAPDEQTAATLASFRQNARQVTKDEADWANPPIPVAVERGEN